jgi:hypothetical protein
MGRREFLKTMLLALVISAALTSIVVFAAFAMSRWFG